MKPQKKTKFNSEKKNQQNSTNEFLTKTSFNLLFLQISAMIQMRSNTYKYPFKYDHFAAV